MRVRYRERDARANRLRLVPAPLKTIPAVSHIQLGKPSTDIDLVEYERIQRARDYINNPRLRYNK